MGVDIRVDSSKHLAESLDQSVIASRPYFNTQLRIMTTRCMMPAKYFCSGEKSASDYHHYGLAAPIYTHFTSPIRRYSDVMVHRLLSAAIGWDPLPKEFSDKGSMQDICEVCVCVRGNMGVTLNP